MSKKGVHYTSPPKRMPNPADLYPLKSYAGHIRQAIADQFHKEMSEAGTKRKKRKS